MRLQLIRHATLKLEYAGQTFLVDPMLSAVGAMPPVPETPNPRPNPLMPLPATIDELLGGITAVLVTHTHRDHWDDAAVELIPKSTPVFCQPADELKFRGWGFLQVIPVEDRHELTTPGYGTLALHRTGGEHGTGELGRRMAPVSGFVLEHPDHVPLYVAGDTIWCEPVREALDRFRPGWVFVNAGAAQFLEGGPITMSAADVVAVASHAHDARIVAVHMDAMNHCLLTRADLAAYLNARGLRDWVRIPVDGEVMFP